MHSPVQLLRNVSDKTGLSIAKKHDQHIENDSCLATFASIPMGEVPSGSIFGLHSTYLGNIPV